MFEDGLAILRERERELRRLEREKRDNERERQRQQLQAMEQVTTQNLSMSKISAGPLLFECVYIKQTCIFCYCSTCCSCS